MTARQGWVDLQVNGYLGIDFSAPGLTVAAVRRVVRELAQRGTAQFCPTVISAPAAVYEANLPVLAAAMREPDLRPALPGIHLEGPFLDRTARGAHPLEHLRSPDIAFLERLLALAEGQTRLLTLAPELPGAEDLIRCAVAHRCVVSLGHHLADEAAIDRAVRAGATCCTHLGNGIPGALPRHPNPIWSQLADDRLTAMVISDGHHLPDAFLRVAWRVKGPSRFVIVSDAAPVAGLPPGEYRCMGLDVRVDPSGRIAPVHGEGLAGSGATLAQCVARFESLGVATPAEIDRAARLNPLRLLGLAAD